jgi:flagellar motor switch protein FliG
LSSLVDFEDLDLLDGGDLRSVLDQVTRDQMLNALIGVPASLRQRLLTKLTVSASQEIESQIQSRDPVPFEAVQSAQLAVVEALCRLSRGGQIAFDDPADMVA